MPEVPPDRYSIVRSLDDNTLLVKHLIKNVKLRIKCGYCNRLYPTIYRYGVRERTTKLATVEWHQGAFCSEEHYNFQLEREQNATT